MSKLQKAIEELLKKQKEVELYSEIKESLQDILQTQKASPEIRVRVVKTLQAYCDKCISAIEGAEEPINPKTASIEEEAVFEVPLEKPVLKEKPIIDPLKFIVKYRDWQDKSVLVTDGFGNKVEGKVIGAAFPNLRVEFLDGTILPTNPEDVELR